MKGRIGCFTIAATVVLHGILGGSEVLALANVYPAKVAMKGAIQQTSPSGSSILKEKITGDDLHNLVRGRALGADIPTNEVLAVAVDCENDLISIIVYNTNNSSILAIVAELEVEESARKNLQALYIVDMNMESGGNDTHAIDSGEFMLSGKASLVDPNTPKCFNSLKLGGLGVLRIVVEGVEIKVLITKATIKTSGNLIGTANLDDF